MNSNENVKKAIEEQFSNSLKQKEEELEQLKDALDQETQRSSNDIKILENRLKILEQEIQTVIIITIINSESKGRMSVRTSGK